MKKLLSLLIILLILIILAIGFVTLKEKKSNTEYTSYKPVEPFIHEVSEGSYSSSGAIGEQQTALILVDYVNKKDLGFTKEEISKMIFDQGGRSLNAFFRENSYNNAWFNGETFGWYQVGASALQEASDVHQVLNNLQRTAFEVSDQDIDFSMYEGGRFIIYSIRPPLSREIEGQVANHGADERDIETPEGTISASVVWINVKDPASWKRNREQLLHLTTHEMGHSLGLGHSYGYLCSAKAKNAREGYCGLQVSGNKFDTMGCGASPGGHFTAPDKEKLGWFSDSNIQTVTNSGIYKIKPLEIITDELQVIKIQTDSFLFEDSNEGGHYYIEYRVPIGFEVGLSDKLDYSGIMINVKTKGRVALVDLHPELSEEEKRSFTNYVLHQGETFNDELNKIKITTIDITDDEATVSIEFY